MYGIYINNSSRNPVVLREGYNERTMSGLSRDHESFVTVYVLVSESEPERQN